MTRRTAGSPRVICSASAAAEIVPARRGRGAGAGRPAPHDVGRRRHGRLRWRHVRTRRPRVVRGRIGARRMIAATCSARCSSGLWSSSSKKRATGDGWATWVSSWAITSAGGAGDARWIVSPVVAATLPTLARARRDADAGRDVHRTVTDDRRRQRPVRHGDRPWSLDAMAGQLGGERLRRRSATFTGGPASQPAAVAVLVAPLVAASAPGELTRRGDVGGRHHRAGRCCCRCGADARRRRRIGCARCRPVPGACRRDDPGARGGSVGRRSRRCVGSGTSRSRDPDPAANGRGRRRLPGRPADGRRAAPGRWGLVRPGLDGVAPGRDTGRDVVAPLWGSLWRRMTSGRTGRAAATGS